MTLLQVNRPIDNSDFNYKIRVNPQLTGILTN